MASALARAICSAGVLRRRCRPPSLPAHSQTKDRSPCKGIPASYSNLPIVGFYLYHS